jgi:VanZ family protein
MKIIKYTFRSLFFIYISLVLFFSLYSFNNTQVNLSEYIFGIRADRYAHFIMFFPFPFSAWFAFGGIIRKFAGRWSMVMLCLSGITISSITEVLQKLNPDRGFDYIDLIANYSGIITGTLLVIFLDQYAKNVWPRRLQ